MNAPGHNPTTDAGRVCLLALLLVMLVAPATAQMTDPRAPDAITLPELGRLNGMLKQVTAVNERFGRQIYPVGDVDGDNGPADWILTHRRCDTSFGGYAVIELLLYHGVRGGLPPTSAGIRIGPSEIDADCSFIGAGDYDGDGHRDLAISQRILHDPYSGDYFFSAIVVYWNDGAGRFSNADTSHLTAPNQRVCIAFPDNERYARVPMQCDLDRDGAEDLVAVTYGAERVDTVRHDFPWVLVYRGRRNARWGRNGVPARPDWQLWQRLFTKRVSVLDHDGDGALDIVMFGDEGEIGRRGGMSVLYGRRGALPDTGAIEQVAFVRIDGHDGKQGQLIDLTGDRVPELIVSTGDTVLGSTWRWLIYVGRRNQRLSQQYGSGNDAPRPGDSLWWGRPWTEIWTPHRHDPIWSNSSYATQAPGDIGLDGVDDFCAGTYPFVVCYNGGMYLDSWIDASMTLWLADDEMSQGHLAVLGDIDGSGSPSVGAPLSGGGVAFVGSSSRVPHGGDPIRLPEGTDRPVSAPILAPGSSTLALTIGPIPATARVHVGWPAGRGGSGVALLDLDGRELRRWLLPPGVAELAVDLTGLPAGVYLISVVSDGRQATMPFVHFE